jgi:hypothetical protein
MIAARAPRRPKKARAPRIGPSLRRTSSAISARLPRGWRDLIFQVALFLLVYQGYQLVRGFVDGRSGVAFTNAERIMDLERSLGTFFEPGLQQALLDHRWLIDLSNWAYFNTHFVVTAGFLTWIYLYRNDHFCFVRNMFMVAMVLALVGYAAFPTAPPRMFGELGFTDTIATYTGIEQDTSSASFLVNPYAAVPSMHIAFALMVAAPAVSMVSSAWARAAWSAYPLMVFFVIVVTANHFWFDAAAGAAVACTAAISAHRLARLRPDRWAWRGGTGEAVA